MAANVIFEIKGDAYALTAGGQAIEKGKLTLDTEKSPARVDLLIEEGKDKGQKQLAIARLRAGKLEWCAGPAGGGRPREFASAKGSEDNYAQFERLQK